MMNTTDLLLWEKVLEKVVIEKAPERDLKQRDSETEGRCYSGYSKMIVLTQVFTANFVVFCATVLFMTQGATIFHAVLGPEYEYFLLGIYTAMLFTVANCNYKLHIGISSMMVMWQSITTYASYLELIKSIYEGFDPKNATKDLGFDIFYIAILWLLCLTSVAYYSFSGLLVLLVTVDEILTNPINYRSRKRKLPRY